MLVLSRRVGEIIRINDKILLQVLEIQRGKVVFGFDAPMDIKITREEIYQKNQNEGVK